MSVVSLAPVSLPSICMGTPINSPTFGLLLSPLEGILPTITPLVSGGNRKMTFTGYRSRM